MMNLETFKLISYIWIGVGAITFIILVFTNIRAPYGRHATDKWGVMIDNKWGWFWMEMPALLLFPLLAIFGPTTLNSMGILLVTIWSVHYVNRTIIFPFRIKTKGKKIPLTIVASALFFNGVNGFLNGYFIGYLSEHNGELSDWNVLLGLIIFSAGLLINQITDTKLISLRKNNKGYVIPKGWLFKYISCPNHFGEIIEWAGFAIIAWNLPALTFALWTFYNLVPRALNHHDWYREQFEDYPKERKALIPFIR